MSKPRTMVCSQCFSFKKYKNDRGRCVTCIIRNLMKAGEAKS